MKVVTPCIRFFLHFILYTLSKADIIHQRYTMEPSLNNKVSNASLMASHHSESLTGCSAMCGELCACFGFNPQLKMCRIHQSCDPSDMIINETGWRNFFPDACDEPWLPYIGHCYLFNGQRMAWQAAYEYCQALGSHLVDIRSPDEENWIRTIRENKNIFMLAYLLWRTLSGKHSQIHLHMQVRYYGNGLVDAGFVYIKIYRRSEVDSLDQLASAVRKSATSINEVVVFGGADGEWLDWKTLTSNYFIPFKGIRKFRQFVFLADKPASSAIWLGGDDMENEGQFLWSWDNSTLVYSNWKTGEPNNYGNEDCIVLENAWNDDHCSTSWQFICKKSIHK